MPVCERIGLGEESTPERPKTRFLPDLLKYQPTSGRRLPRKVSLERKLHYASS